MEKGGSVLDKERRFNPMTPGIEVAAYGMRCSGEIETPAGARRLAAMILCSHGELVLEEAERSRRLRESDV